MKGEECLRSFLLACLLLSLVDSLTSLQRRFVLCDGLGKLCFSQSQLRMASVQKVLQDFVTFCGGKIQFG